jgi:Holliday junction resolvase
LDKVKRSDTMANTPEKRVKDKVVKILKEFGAYYFFPATYGFGRSGVPDIVCCFNGNFFAVECKAGKNKPTTLQEREMEAIRNTGGTALVINEENTHHVRILIEEMSY